MASGLPDDTELLPEALRNCGYRTFGVGKWHLGYAKSSQTPWGRGFEKFTGYLGGFPIKIISTDWLQSEVQ